MVTTYTPETEAFYALPAEIRERAEELAGPIREMTRMEVLLAIGRGMIDERASGDWGQTAFDAATEILTYLGIGTEASGDPGIDRRRDRVCQVIEAAISRALVGARMATPPRRPGSRKER